MASQMTPNLKLHKWIPDDYVQMEEFNDNFEKIDENSKNVIERLLEESRKIGNMPSLGEEYRDLATTIVEREVNAKDFGVKGDGSNETILLQKAINQLQLTGGIVLLPAGRYRAKGLMIPPNVRFKGVGGATRLVASSPGGYMFQMLGSIGEPIAFAEDRTSGDGSIETVGPHNLKINDSIMVISQRDCLSNDAGLWRLGVGTPGVTHAFLGEFKNIRSIASPTSVILSSPLFFPSYNKDKSRETSQYAGQSALIRKVNFIENAFIEDLIVEGELAGVLNVHHGYNCGIKNVIWEGAHDGAFAVFRESLACTGERLSVQYKYDKDAADHYKRNAFKVISSHLCGFKNCKADNATQAVDFTFEEGKICTAYAFLTDSDILNATDNSATSHGGTYATQFLNNRMIGCRKGVSTRSRNSIISGNVITGYRSHLSTYGVSIYDGWARDCIVSDNMIIGFGSGVEVTEKEDGVFDYVGLTVDSNKIHECLNGVYVRRHPSNKYTGDTAIAITNNTINRSYGYGGTSAKLIRIDSYVHGVKIDNNTLIVNNVCNGAIYFAANASDFIVTFNKMFSGNSNARSVWVEKPTDLELFPLSKVNGYYFSNDTGTLKRPDEEFVSFTSRARDITGILPPVADNVYSLGFSTRRWSTVYAGTGAINTSDRNYKQQIAIIPDEVLDAWSEVQFSMFKFNDAVELKGEEARWHIGIIAQDIEEVFKAYGLDAFDYGLLCVDEHGDEYDGDQLIKKKGKIYSIRADECQFLEMALMRRELNKLRSQ